MWQRAVVTDPLCWFIFKMCFINNYLFFLTSRKSTKRKFQRWPSWQNPWVSNFKFILHLWFWMENYRILQKNTSPCDYPIIFHSCQSQGLFNTDHIVLMLCYALFKSHLSRGPILYWNGHLTFGAKESEWILFVTLHWALRTTIILSWLKRFRWSLKLKFCVQTFHRLDNLKRAKMVYCY